ncbi:MAG: hypothetical protein QOJ29_2808 [Thermoleophilaceae bacterium]|jgi:hypothetical protein|nr:hypothetical protein [Thermoleophilaceae bacterium]
MLTCEHRLVSAVSAGDFAGTHRLVLVTPVEVVPRGYLYPLEVSQYSTPIVWFEVLAYQEIPRCEPGAIVEVSGEVLPGREVTVTAGDGLTIHPRGKLHRGEGSPLFAERYSGAVHPAFAERQAGWQRSPRLPTTIAEWDSHLQKQESRSRRALIAMAVFIAVALLLLVATVVWGHGGVGVRGGYYGGGGSGVGALASYRRARRSRRVVENARRARTEEAVDMTMRLWWSVGDGWGVVPVASLRDATDMSTVVHLPLATVPERFDPPEWVPVLVRGLRTTGTPVIEMDELELWPAESAMQILHGHRRRADRKAAKEDSRSARRRHDRL